MNVAANPVFASFLLAMAILLRGAPLHSMVLPCQAHAIRGILAPVPGANWGEMDFGGKT